MIRFVRLNMNAKNAAWHHIDTRTPTAIEYSGYRMVLPYFRFYDDCIRNWNPNLHRNISLDIAKYISMKLSENRLTTNFVHISVRETFHELTAFSKQLSSKAMRVQRSISMGCFMLLSILINPKQIYCTKIEWRHMANDPRNRKTAKFTGGIFWDVTLYTFPTWRPYRFLINRAPCYECLLANSNFYIDLFFDVTQGQCDEYVNNYDSV